jgi:hypothetical protein
MSLSRHSAKPGAIEFPLILLNCVAGKSADTLKLMAGLPTLVIREAFMLDLIFIALGVAGFASMFALVRGLAAL